MKWFIIEISVVMKIGLAVVFWGVQLLILCIIFYQTFIVM